MAKKFPLTTMVRSRVTDVYAKKITVYAKKKGMTESAVIRAALQKFLRNVSIKCLQENT